MGQNLNHHTHKMTVHLNRIVRNGQHLADVYQCQFCTTRGIKLTRLGEMLDSEQPVVSKLLHLVRPGGESKLESAYGQRET